MAFDSIVIDLSHNNGSPNLSMASAAGVAGIIHKATQGLAFTDPKYIPNKALAVAANLLWGAYHFGTGDDPIAQAKHFLSVVKPTPQTLLVLDFEKNTTPGETTMTTAQAQAFVTYIQRQTGIWPGLYGGGDMKAWLGATVDPVLRNCWLWLSECGPIAHVPPTWPAWTLWQYTDGHIGENPINIPGIGLCDQNCYNGTPAQLAQLWQSGSLNPAQVAAAQPVVAIPTS